MTNQTKNFIDEENKRICNEIRNNHNKWGFKIAQDLAGQGSLGVYEDDKKIISSFQISLIKMIVKEINETQIELCKEFANMPLDKRESGWQWILRFRDTISSKLNSLIQ